MNRFIMNKSDNKRSKKLNMRKFVSLLLQSAKLSDLSLEGDITVPGAPDDEDDKRFNTLDEPVSTTVVSTWNKKQ